MPNEFIYWLICLFLFPFWILAVSAPPYFSPRISISINSANLPTYLSLTLPLTHKANHTFQGMNRTLWRTFTKKCQYTVMSPKYTLCILFSGGLVKRSHTSRGIVSKNASAACALILAISIISFLAFNEGEESFLCFFNRQNCSFSMCALWMNPDTALCLYTASCSPDDWLDQWLV